MAITRSEFFKSTGILALSGMSAVKGLDVFNPIHRLNESQKKIIKPKALKIGDTIGLVAPASPIYNDSEFDQMLVDLKEIGFKLKLGKHARNRRGYLAGLDKDRADDLMAMFKDSDVDGIICIRGGWGSNRILDHLNFDIIAENPKVFCGFSDITALHLSIFNNTGLITFHGPVGKSKWTDITLNAFKDVIFAGEEAIFKIPEDDAYQYTLNDGEAEGRLLGGNLTVLTSMIGSKYLPDFNDAILYLEDVGESVYRIDRMMVQLKLSGILDQIKGFVFGKCTACEAGSNSLSLQQVFDDHITPLNIPAFYGALISHEDDNITLPVGLRAKIDAKNRTIQLLESGISK